MTAAIVALAIGVVLAVLALVLAVRALVGAAPSIVAAAEREAAALKGKRAAELQRDAALEDARTQRDLAASTQRRLALAEAVIATIREKETARAVEKIATASDARDTWAALGELLAAGDVPDVPGPGGATAEDDRPAAAAVRPSSESTGAEHGGRTGGE